jgi:hypothetical protein
MDQLFFATKTSSKRNNGNYSDGWTQSKLERTTSEMGKRQLRRKKAEARQKVFLSGSRDRSPVRNLNGSKSSVKVDSILATIRGQGDKERVQIISDGLPHLEQGFPSDHLPIGALFVGELETNKISKQQQSPTEASSPASFQMMKSGVSTSVQRRREASRTSFGLRRRHNAVLNAVTDWLVERGVSSIVRDQPLYKNDLLQSKLGAIQQQLKRKSRAPDLMGVVVTEANDNNGDHIDNVLVIVEVAVASDPHKVRDRKLSKYYDLVSTLNIQPETAQNKRNVVKCHLFALVLHENGSIPDQTRNDIKELVKLTGATSFALDDELHMEEETFSQQQLLESEVDQFCDHLECVMSSYLRE